jgi:WD40 repeat protein
MEHSDEYSTAVEEDTMAIENTGTSVVECPLDLATKSPQLIHDEVICQATNEEFVKSTKFSPDGSCIVTGSESNFLTFWNVDPSVVASNSYYPMATNDASEIDGNIPLGSNLNLTNAINAGESIYDLAWYPLMNAQSPATCCVAVSTRDHPVVLWDVITGELRCKYTGYDHMDELESAHSLAFNLTGDKIYCGANRVIRIFDAAMPGRQETNVPTCKSRSDKFGQKGIISAISFCPDYSGLYGVGSFAQSVAIYAENTNKRVAMIQSLGMGITHLKWSPCGHYLWSGGRKSSDVICSDIRMTKREVGRVTRTLNSNQRVSFDIDPWGHFLVTGTQDGKVLVYDTASFELTSSVDCTSDPAGPGFARDCVNSATLHPYSSLLVTATGQRHFDDTYGEYGDGEDINAQEHTDSSSRIDCSKHTTKYSSGLQLWSLPKK